MAENQQDRDTEDLLDEPSQTRIDDLREKGQVAQSRELTGLLSLVACAATLYAMAPQIGSQIMEYMGEVFRVDHYVKYDMAKNLSPTLMKFLKVIAWVVLPISVAGFFTGIVVGFAQVGSLFTFTPLEPNLERIDPLKGMQKYFSARMYIEGARMTLKVILTCVIAYGLIKAQVFESSSELLYDPVHQFESISRISKSFFLSLILVFGFFAGIDYWLNRQEWLKQVRLTKDEAKEEAKQKDGNPQIKARIKTIQRDLARKRMMQAVRKADVIITNPTHIAIAIQYDRDKMLAPKVVAKGADLIAARIRKIAQESGVPLVENVPLARTLFKTVKVNQAIPRALYQAVAEILAYVYRLKNRTN